MMTTGRILARLALTIAMLGGLGHAMDEDVLGLWIDASEEAAILVETCGSKLCGRIVWMLEPVGADGAPKRDRANPDPALRDRPLIGVELLAGFVRGDEPGQWRGGRVYDPTNGKSYKSRLDLRGKILELRGYVAIPLFGRTTRWRRPLPSHPAQAALADPGS